jgi:hypothetical protein
MIFHDPNLCQVKFGIHSHSCRYTELNTPGSHSYSLQLYVSTTHISHLIFSLFIGEYLASFSRLFQWAELFQWAVQGCSN